MGLGILLCVKDKTFCWPLLFILVLCRFLSLQAGAAQQTSEDKPRPPAAPAGTHPTTLPKARLKLRVYNYAHLDSASLAASEKVAGAILENVGIQTVWVDCPAYKAPPKTQSATDIKYSACESEMGTTDLVLRILPRNMSVKLRRSNDSLGSAQACPETEPACELNVYHHRVDELARNGYRADRILGHVIAHEIAHVLLGPRHSGDGILRGKWSSSDLQRISLGMQFNFSVDQSRQLRLAVLRRIIPPFEQATAQANLTARESQ